VVSSVDRACRCRNRMVDRGQPRPAPIIPNAPGPRVQAPPLGPCFRAREGRAARDAAALLCLPRFFDLLACHLTGSHSHYLPPDFVDGIASVMTGCKQKGGGQKWQVRGT